MIRVKHSSPTEESCMVQVVRMFECACELWVWVQTKIKSVMVRLDLWFLSVPLVCDCGFKPRSVLWWSNLICDPCHGHNSSHALVRFCLCLHHWKASSICVCICLSACFLMLTVGCLTHRGMRFLVARISFHLSLTVSQVKNSSFQDQEDS